MKALLSTLAGLAILAVAAGPAHALSQNGPYYAQPSWDQQIPAASRFIVLTDWGGAAVLDRETGLVWQRDPGGAATWTDAILDCQINEIGGRYGWRLPAFEELLTLIDPATTVVFSGAPFTLGTNTSFWTATTVAGNSSFADIVILGAVFGAKAKTDLAPFWCVRGYQGAQNPQ